MEEYKKKIEQEIQNLIKTLDSIKREQTNAPKGSLRVSNRKEGIRYYHRYRNNPEENFIEEYLSKRNNAQLICQLAQKQYLHALKPVLEQELNILGKMGKQYAPEKKGEIFDRLSIERKKLVQPLFLSAEEKFQRWRAEDYIRYTGYPENLRYETKRGELVRSKSELIIANLLFKEKDNLHYRYEEGLHLKKTNLTFHPDFSIMSRKRGRVIYWEHAGMVDDSWYVNEFVRKINIYIKEGYIPGVDIIVTYETSEVPLDVAVVRKIIKEYLLI